MDAERSLEGEEIGCNNPAVLTATLLLKQNERYLLQTAFY